MRAELAAVDGGVSTWTWNGLMLVGALLSTGGCGYYVWAVLDEARSLFRAAFAFFVFGLVSAVFIRRLL